MFKLYCIGAKTYIFKYGPTDSDEADTLRTEEAHLAVENLDAGSEYWFELRSVAMDDLVVGGATEQMLVTTSTFYVFWCLFVKTLFSNDFHTIDVAIFVYFFHNQLVLF